MRLFSPVAKQEKARDKGTDATSRFTVNGPVSLNMRRWQLPDGGGSRRPGEQILGLPMGEPSVGFRRMACRLALDASGSFAKEAEMMGELGMGPVSREKLREVVCTEGRRVQAAQKEQSFALPWQARNCPDAKREGTLACMGVDGVMTRQVTDQEKRKRRRKVAGKRSARSRAGKKLKPLPKLKPGADGPWKEVKIVGAYQQNHLHRHWRSTTLSHLMAAVLILQVARRVGLNLAQVTVAVVDGAEWIEARLREHMPNLTAIILDFYHLLEHINAAANEAWGEGTPQAKGWANRLVAAIRHEGFAAFDALLEQGLVDCAASPEAQAALNRLRQYVSQRREMVNYPYFEAQGWPIGSGPTESMAGILTTRIRGRGRRWDADNIDSVMALEAMDIGGERELYWDAQTRLPAQRKIA
jgi:hypothetical protein